MKKFVFLYTGFQEITKENMETWMKWFATFGDKTVDGGNPFGPGREITKAGTKQLPSDADAITGYTIINAASMEEAEKIAAACPYVTGIRIYEAMPM